MKTRIKVGEDGYIIEGFLPCNGNFSWARIDDRNYSSLPDAITVAKNIGNGNRISRQPENIEVAWESKG